MIAALYIDAARGPYTNMPGIDAWGIERDATLYPGPHPVIAHPPCGPWGRFRWRCNDDPRQDRSPFSKCSSGAECSSIRRSRAFGCIVGYLRPGC